MKVKMLVAAAITSVCAASFAFAAPIYQHADDMGDSTTMQSPSNDNNSNGSMQNQSTDMSNPGATPAGPSTPSTDSNTSNTNDDMSADTATGDDDY